jgi:ABC-type sugar transport system ATPase subunit
VALDNVDYNVWRGKVNVIIGENGAGKSTLMKILAGVQQPSLGEMGSTASRSIFQHPRGRRPRYRHGAPGAEPV